jgi:hypothetical protein
LINRFGSCEGRVCVGTGVVESLGERSGASSPSLASPFCRGLSVVLLLELSLALSLALSLVEVVTVVVEVAWKVTMSPRRGRRGRKEVECANQ